MLRTPGHRWQQAGFSLLEVLLTFAILAFGLLGLAALQTVTMNSNAESYQRAQAEVIVDDMAARLKANGANAAAYVTANPLGTGDTTQPASCATLTGSALDLCEWNKSLLGAGETNAGNASVGAMVGARGCIAVVQAQVTASCTPAIYGVTVAWQGLTSTVAPTNTCGQYSYDTNTGGSTNDTHRRLLQKRVVIPLNQC